MAPEGHIQRCRCMVSLQAHDGGGADIKKIKTVGDEGIQGLHSRWDRTRWARGMAVSPPPTNRRESQAGVRRYRHRGYLEAKNRPDSWRTVEGKRAQMRRREQRTWNAKVSVSASREGALVSRWFAFGAATLRPFTSCSTIGTGPGN